MCGISAMFSDSHCLLHELMNNWIRHISPDNVYISFVIVHTLFNVVRRNWTDNNLSVTVLVFIFIRAGQSEGWIWLVRRMSDWFKEFACICALNCSVLLTLLGNADKWSSQNIYTLFYWCVFVEDFDNDGGNIYQQPCVRLHKYWSMLIIRVTTWII